MTGTTHIVVMGPSGSGKTTIGSALAQALDARFIDADDLHPDSNVAKMRLGTPLTDADRWPWLERVGVALSEQAVTVVACSALKRSYRDAIRSHAPEAFCVELTVDAELLDRRMTDRPGHFMPPSLLQSQLATLEPLADDEPGIRTAADSPISEVVGAIREALEAR